MLSMHSTIVCKGYIHEKYPCSKEKVTDINFSDIFSELIQAAGMGCEYYASDMFIELTDIKEAIDNLEERVFYIGIRDSGVDGNSFIKARIDRNSCDYTQYIKLYKLAVGISGDDYVMILERITRYDVLRDIEEEIL